MRAQISRIAQTTNIVPAGLWREQEENKREIEENAPEEGEIVKPSVPEMADVKRWVHLAPQILLQGRTTHMEGKPLEGEEDVEPEELLKREVAKDPWEPRLKPIINDNKTPGGMPAWVLRSHGVANNSFVDEKTGSVSKNYGTVVVKSMWWPGSYTFYNNQRTLFIYCGDGLKHEQQSYYPVEPPSMMQEREEKPVCAEPNPTEEWLKKKAELDAAKEKQPDE